MLGKFNKLSRLNRGIIIASLLAIVLACVVPAFLIYVQHHTHGIEQPAVKPYSAPKNSVSGDPVNIDIPSLQIDVPVIDGQYDPSTHEWTLTGYKAQYLVDSARPNNIAGKTFIYGHYNYHVFAVLHNIKPGAALSLTTSNGYRFNYKFKSTFTTSPSNLSVLDNTRKPVLYVQTCSGIFFQHRQIFIFAYEGYDKLKKA